MTTREEAAWELWVNLYCDSNVVARVDDILWAIDLDAPPIPTKAECELLVNGGEDGEVSQQLKEKFPSIDALIDGLVT